MSSTPLPPVRFFTMGDAGYFPGAVALVNSLRLVGHEEPIVFLDLGLHPHQRRQLAQECALVDAPRGHGDHPYLYQPFPKLLDPSGICVILDSDVVVTQPLDALVDAARDGAIAAYPDPVVPLRFVPDWAPRFDLRAPLRARDRYVNSGLLAFDAAARGDFLDRWWEVCQELVDRGYEATDEPVRYADQDVLNALLMSEFTGAARVLDDAVPMTAAEMARVRIVDLDRLDCRYEDRPVTALHAITLPKPWMGGARTELGPSAYVDCLRRLLVGPGLRIVVDEQQLPRWLRSGWEAALTRSALHAVYRVPRPVIDWARQTRARLRRAR